MTETNVENIPLDLLALTRHLMTAFTCPACHSPALAWVAERPRVIPIEEAGLNMIGVTVYPCLDHFRFQVSGQPNSIESFKLTDVAEQYLPAST